MLDQMMSAWADTSGMIKTLQKRANPYDSSMGYQVSYQQFGDVKMDDYLVETYSNSYISSEWSNVIVPEWEKKIHILEAFNGRYFFKLPNESGPDSGGAGMSASGGGGGGGGIGAAPQLTIMFTQQQIDLLNQSYDALKESIYSSLVMQTRFKPLFDKINLVIDSNGIQLDFSALEQYFQDQIAANLLSGLGDLADFNHSAGDMLAASGWGGNEILVNTVKTLPITSELEALLSNLGASSADLTKCSSGDDVILGGNAKDTISGRNGNDVLSGGGNDDRLYGNDDSDTLMGGAGNDLMSGDAGSDTYFFGRGDGQDMVRNYDTSTGKTDVLQFAADIAPGDVLFSRSSDNLVLAIKGTTDKVTVENYFYQDGASSYKLEQIKFADGTTWDFNTVKFKAFSGSSTNDTITGLSTNDLLNGGEGNDTMDGKAGNDFLIGGAGTDTITTGAGYDVIAFNRGDGQDTITASTGKDNTLSLGNGIQYADLLFSKSSNDLVLTTGTNEKITFKDWYLSTNNQSIANLQIVIEGTTDYDATSANAINNKKVEQFNFDGLVTAFDQARTANPALTSWSLSSSLLNFYLSGSDTAAIGGDLAYQYARNGNLSNISAGPAQAILGSSQFGVGSQNLRAISELQDMSPRLA